MKYTKHFHSKTGEIGLINFKDFVKNRQQILKIINNPQEQNWKKAILMKQILQLYKPHLNKRFVLNQKLQRQQFDMFHKYSRKNSCKNIDWDNYQDYQVNKMQKMAEGLANWDQQYANRKITKVDYRIENRRKIVAKKQQQNHPILQKKHHSTQKFISKNNLFNKFASMNNQKSQNFCHQKRQITKLKRKAVKEYGINFANYPKKLQPQQLNFDRFRQKQSYLFNKFIANNNLKSFKTKNQDQKQVFVQENSTKNILNILLKSSKTCNNSPIKLSHHCKTSHGFRKTNYVRFQ